MGEKGARRKPHSPFLQISTLQAIYLSESWIFPVGEPSPLSFSTTSVYICNIVQEESPHIQLNMPSKESRTGLLVVAMHYHCSSSPSFIHWWWCCMQWIFIIIGKTCPNIHCRRVSTGNGWSGVEDDETGNKVGRRHKTYWFNLRYNIDTATDDNLFEARVGL